MKTEIIISLVLLPLIITGILLYRKKHDGAGALSLTESFFGSIFAALILFVIVCNISDIINSF